ncbi:MAG TPA: cation diffusion facilitator family transporter [Acidimicrobiales bacterium]
MHQLKPGESWDPFPDARFVDDAAHRHEAHRALWLSALGLTLAGGIELAIALVSGSVGLLGDAIHNLSDVSTSLVGFVGFRVSKRPAVPSHPYGYERAEDMAGLGVAVVIWASAVFAGVVSIHKLIHHGGTTHLGLGMTAAVVGIVGNQIVARYKKRVGGRIQSNTLLADAKHSWLDAVASAGALLGLVGVAAGLWWADGVAGLLVTGFIVHVGWQVTSDVVAHLMDSVDPRVLLDAEEAALSVPGVEHAHLRARWLGRTLLVEVEAFVPPETRLDEAERLGRDVRAAILRTVPECRAVVWSPHALPTA